MTVCYLGLGSNLNKPQRQIRIGIKALSGLPRTSIQKIAGFYHSTPWGSNSVLPNYVNTVVELKTKLSPHGLLHYCQQIENQQGRVRKKKYGARTLDIDILLYGKLTIISPTLTIPHPYMTCRDFVLVPLTEINRDVCLPDGQPLLSFVAHCANHLKKTY